MNLPSVLMARVRGRKVFVRCDFDVPIKEGLIEDDSRLVSSISTIEYILEEGGTVIAAGHIGREGESCQIIVDYFSEVFGKEAVKIKLGNFDAWKLSENFFVLENLRMYDGEETNDPNFARELASIADIYVNEAFGVSHRPHASIAGLPDLLPHFAGFHLLKEIKILWNVLENPKRPLTVIVGGAKIETKLPLISTMHAFADFVLVGGEIAEQDEALIKEQHHHTSGQKGMLLVAELTQDKLDITQKSLENFSQIIERSQTIIWNGPMGNIEKGNEQTTVSLANEIISSKAYKVVGGGDTISLLSKKGLRDKFDFVSVGGGALLTFLSGRSLPGIISLQG